MARDLSREEAQAMAAKSNDLWSDPDVREARSQGIRDSYDEELREKRRQAALAQWADPSKKKQMVERMREVAAERQSPKGVPHGPRTPMSRLRKALEERAENCCEVCGMTADESMDVHKRRLGLHHLTYDKTIPDLADVLLVCCVCHGRIHGDGRKQDRVDLVANAVGKLLKALGVDLEDENFLETPRRVTAYLLEHFLDEDQFEEVMESCQEAVFPTDYDGMLIESSIQAYGICPHHLLPVIYHVDIAYIPEGEGIGLSKLTRIADTCLSLPILQEEATKLLADTLSKTLKTPNVAVFAKGEHLCMRARGVRAHGSSVTTSAVTGIFKEDSRARAEVLALKSL